jgi:hypothetical protein
MTARVRLIPTRDANEAAELARDYLRRGWQPVPIARGQKKPRNNAWQSLAITETNVERYFGDDDNVGLRLGARSGGLTDVDIDCAEALALAKDILPATEAIFGRRSKPRSHRLYITDLHTTEQKATLRFMEPRALANGEEPATLVELRIGAGDKGAQTVAPGSVHPSGEKVRWDTEGEPRSVSGTDLKRAVAVVAAAALLIRHYPASGSRHEAALVLGGVLARGPAGSAEEIKKFVTEIARSAGDEEAEERGNSAAGAVGLLAAGRPTPGLTRMREVWGSDVTNTVAKWLEIDEDLIDRAKGDQPNNQTHRLIALASSANLFHSPEGISYADAIVRDHRETLLISPKATNSGFGGWLRHRFFEKTGGAPSSEALRAALETLAARARYSGQSRDVHVRVANVGDKIYFDLGDEDWSVIEIDARGWRLAQDPPVRFLRRRGMLPVPRPVPMANVDMMERAIDKLFGYINVATEQDFCLVVSYLLSALRGQGPFPVLVLLGEPGAAKSTLLELLKSLVDPNKAPLRTPPRDARDMFVAANNGYLIAYDNLSDLREWLSDMLCRLSTGGGFGTRQLYTDDEEMLFDAMRPVALTAVDNVVARGDLTDRSLFLTLVSIPDDKRRRRKELLSAFERDRPEILGALLDIVAYGLRELPKTKLKEYPRMADFAEWASACEGALWEPGFFAKAYDLNRAGATASVVEEDLIANAIASFMANRQEWIGETERLLRKLNFEADEEIKANKYWPKAPNVLSRRMNRMAGMLRKIGIIISSEPTETNRSGWRIENQKWSAGTGRDRDGQRS